MTAPRQQRGGVAQPLYTKAAHLADGLEIRREGALQELGRLRKVLDRRVRLPHRCRSVPTPQSACTQQEFGMHQHISAASLDTAATF